MIIELNCNGKKKTNENIQLVIDFDEVSIHYGCLQCFACFVLNKIDVFFIPPNRVMF